MRHFFKVCFLGVSLCFISQAAFCETKGGSAAEKESAKATAARVEQLSSGIYKSINTSDSFEQQAAEKIFSNAKVQSELARASDEQLKTVKSAVESAAAMKKEVVNKEIENMANEVKGSLSASNTPINRKTVSSKLKELYGIEMDEKSERVVNNVLANVSAENLEAVAKEGLSESGVKNVKETGIENAQNAETNYADEKKNETVVFYNKEEYIPIIQEIMIENEIAMATQDVIDRGAEIFQISQGSQVSGVSGISDTKAQPSGKTIDSSVKVLNEILKKGKIDITLLETEPGRYEIDGVTTVILEEEEKALKSSDQIELKRRRALLLGEWGGLVTQFAEANNAISRMFYDRSSGFQEELNKVEGSLDGISTITDTDRLVLFELTRGTALSAVRLGLRGALSLAKFGDQR